MVKKSKKPTPFPETPFDNDTDDNYVAPTSTRSARSARSARSSAFGMKRRVHDPDRGLNIAMACILAAVVLAIIISLAVFFATPAKTPNKGYTQHKTITQAPAPSPTPTPQPSQEQTPRPFLVGTVPVQAPVLQTPRGDGILWPQLSQQDKDELVKSHQYDAVANYAQNLRHAVLGDMSRQLDYDLPKLHKNVDYYPFSRGREDEEMYKLQVAQAKQQPLQFGMSEAYHAMFDNQVHPLS
jgi:hypothetical protein